LITYPPKRFPTKYIADFYTAGLPQDEIMKSAILMFAVSAALVVQALPAPLPSSGLDLPTHTPTSIAFQEQKTAAGG